MPDRVLSTATAREAITKMQQIITGDLIDNIENLNRQGQTLCQKDVWDGRLAQEFSSNWPETYRSLQRAQETLEELRGKVDKINENIMRAGGNV